MGGNSVAAELRLALTNAFLGFLFFFGLFLPPNPFFLQLWLSYLIRFILSPLLVRLDLPQT